MPERVLWAAMLVACRGPAHAEPTADAPVEVRLPESDAKAPVNDAADLDGDGCPDRMGRVPGRDDPPIATFCIDKTEVTVSDYARCVDASACPEPEFDDDERKWATWEPRQWNMPVNYVGEDHILPFCKFIGGRLPTYEENKWAFNWGMHERFADSPSQYTAQEKVTGGIFLHPTVPCSEPSDRLPNGVCNLGGGLNELVAEPRNEPGEQIVAAWLIHSVPFESDLRKWLPPKHGHSGLHPWFGFRCAK